MVGDGTRRHWADDGDLADEIELYGELVVAASESEQELTQPQIDELLGVRQRDAVDQQPGGAAVEPGGEPVSSPPRTGHAG